MKGHHAPGRDASRTFCVSIDVERDYRTDGRLSTRGIEEGLATFVDLLRSHGVPHDLMISGEVAERVPRELSSQSAVDCTVGCHGQEHSPGYLNRLNSNAQEAELRNATRTIAARFGRDPRVFRAPNFSANSDTVRILSRLGYIADSSVLPGRRVRRWWLRTIVDHRRIPNDPFFSGPVHYPMPGGDSILEVPITPNPLEPGAPLGLGYLNYAGGARFEDALGRSVGNYVVFLAHTWEMVSWRKDDPVAPWVRSASKAPSAEFDALLSRLEGWSFTNLDGIVARETQRFRGASGGDAGHPSEGTRPSSISR